MVHVHACYVSIVNLGCSYKNLGLGYLSEKKYFKKILGLGLGILGSNVESEARVLCGPCLVLASKILRSPTSPY